MHKKSFVIWLIIAIFSGLYLYYGNSEGTLGLISILGFFIGGIMVLVSLVRPSK